MDMYEYKMQKTADAEGMSAVFLSAAFVLSYCKIYPFSRYLLGLTPIF